MLENAAALAAHFVEQPERLRANKAGVLLVPAPLLLRGGHAGHDGALLATLVPGRLLLSSCVVLELRTQLITTVQKHAG